MFFLSGVIGMMMLILGAIFFGAPLLCMALVWLLAVAVPVGFVALVLVVSVMFLSIGLGVYQVINKLIREE